MSDPFRIVMVCTGNSCRSPAAEMLLKKSLAKAGYSQDVIVESAGIAASPGLPASKGTVTALEKLECSVDGFCSQPVTPELCEKTHLLLVMETRHRDFIEEHFPHHSDKIRLLGNFLYPHGPENIPDPVGAEQTYYDQVIEIIDYAIQGLVQQWPMLRERFYLNQEFIIALGADHRGFKYKEILKQQLQEKGFPVIDCGTVSDESCDHPDFAFKVSERVSLGLADRGVLVCSSGHGMLISANKVPHIRAIMPLNVEHARMSRSHNNANVITFGADYMDDSLIGDILFSWLETKYLGGRYQWRVNKISHYEHSVHC